MSPAPDAAQRDAAHQLELTRRMREVEASILSRAPEHDLEPSLDRIRAVMELLGDPQRTFPVIHVTGTNGKTSTARIIEALLRELGLKTGRFTSPHLHSMLERIAVGGSADRRRALPRRLRRRHPLRRDRRRALDPRRRPADDLLRGARRRRVRRVRRPAGRRRGRRGRHGRLVGRDERRRRPGVRRHADRPRPPPLPRRHGRGDRGREGRHHQGRRHHRRRAAAGGRRRSRCSSSARPRSGARIVFEGNDFGVTARDVAVGGQQISLRGLAAEYPDLFLPLHGTHQAQNAAVAVAAVEAFLGGGETGARHRRACGPASRPSTRPGRLEIVRRSPTVLVDAAHNPAGRAGAARRHPGLVHLRPARRGGRRDEGQGGRRDPRGARAGARRGRRDPHLVAPGDVAAPARRDRHRRLR